MKHLAEQWWSWCGVETTICLLVSTKPKTWLWTQQKLSMLHFKSRAWPWKGSAAQNSWLSTSETLSCGTQHHTPGQGDLGRGCTYLRCWSHTHTRSHTHIYIHNPHHLLLKYYWEHSDKLHGDWHEDFAVCEDGWRGHQDLTPLLGNQFQGSMQEESSLHHERLLKGRSRTV